jgi:membrane-associated protease RseP (regulator of RpoE activity)
VQTWDDDRGYLGVHILDLNDDLGQYFKVKEGEGVLITEVEEDSPAEDAGLMAGDVVVEFDGKTVKNTEKFRKYVAATEPGEDVALVVKRKGRKKTIEAEIGEMESPMGQFMETFRFPAGRKSTGGRIVIKDEDGEVEIIDLPGGTGSHSCKPHMCTPGRKVHKIHISDLEGLEELEELEDLDEILEFHKMEGLFELEDLEELEEEIEDLQKEMQELRRELEKLKK